MAHTREMTWSPCIDLWRFDDPPERLRVRPVGHPPEGWACIHGAIIFGRMYVVLGPCPHPHCCQPTYVPRVYIETRGWHHIVLPEGLCFVKLCRNADVHDAQDACRVFGPGSTTDGDIPTCLGRECFLYLSSN